MARAARRWRPDRNPLRRRWDRIETWLMTGLFALFLAGIPVSWLGAGRWAHQAGLSEQRAQRDWRERPGVVLSGAPFLSPRVLRMPVSATAQVPAAWAGPDGRRRVTQITVPVGTATGAKVQIWVVPTGQITGPPLTSAQLARRVVAAEVLAVMTLATLMIILAGLARSQLNRRRLAGWESQWALIGPRWTRHHR